MRAPTLLVSAGLGWAVRLGGPGACGAPRPRRRPGGAGPAPAAPQLAHTAPPLAPATRWRSPLPGAAFDEASPPTAPLGPPLAAVALLRTLHKRRTHRSSINLAMDFTLTLPHTHSHANPNPPPPPNPHPAPPPQPHLCAFPAASPTSPRTSAAPWTMCCTPQTRWCRGPRWSCPTRASAAPRATRVGGPCGTLRARRHPACQGWCCVVQTVGACCLLQLVVLGGLA